MYAAFNTLQLELERLIILRESITSSGQAGNEVTKLSELDRKIYSHEKAIKVINREHQEETRIATNNAKVLNSLNS
jgi:hypothetical protein